MAETGIEDDDDEDDWDPPSWDFGAAGDLERRAGAARRTYAVRREYAKNKARGYAVKGCKKL